MGWEKVSKVTILESALELAEKYGFKIFPCVPNSKIPAKKKFSEIATNDPEQIKNWWAENQNYNIGISLKGLVAIDIDVKGGKNGEQTVFQLEMGGNEFCKTYTQKTPSGGRHFVYRTDRVLRQGTNTLGIGIDTRTEKGYILGSGSVLEGGYYSRADFQCVRCPEWIETRLFYDEKQNVSSLGETRAARWLESAPSAISGQGGDEHTYKVACRVRDFGVSRLDCIDLMQTHWNPRCEHGR